MTANPDGGESCVPGISKVCGVPINTNVCRVAYGIQGWSIPTHLLLNYNVYARKHHKIQNPVNLDQ